MRAALDAYAAGRGSEHAVLTALAACRLLVPVVALLTAGESGGPGGLRREKSSEMALPTLIGADGRAALPAFTCLDTLTCWRADARPVLVPAAGVWQSGVQLASGYRGAPGRGARGLAPGEAECPPGWRRRAR